MKKTNAEKGITLLALVVTIIVLMILAGITISLTIGQNGIISKAQYAKVQSEIAGEKEQLSMAIYEATLDNTGNQPTLEQIKDKIIEKGIATEEKIKVGDDRLQVTTPKEHTYTIDKDGNIEYVAEGEVIVPSLTEANVEFTYTPNTWTTGNVQIDISTTTKGYTLQYSIDGNTWSKYEDPIIAENNESIYVRLWDGINYGGVATGNVTNIDRTNPTLTISQDSGISDRIITINATDKGSGINTIQYNNYGTWQNLSTTDITNGKNAIQTIYLNGTYTFRTIDNVGNITSQSITVTGVIPTVSNLRGGVIISTTDNMVLKDDEGNTVTVPAGFKISSDSATKQEDGIVIEDKEGNQFVWIPVANISNYIRMDFDRENGEYDQYIEAMPSDEQTSVNTYHGYYIGRYETGDSVSTANKTLRISGDSVTNQAVIKKGQAPYNFLYIYQAQSLAEGIDAANGYKGITKMCSSYAWDTAVNFIQNKVSDYGASSPEGNYNDTTFNYTDITGANQTKTSGSSIIIPTGQTTPICNIYDMGGNVWEWTTETYNEHDSWIDRGGRYCDNCSEYSAGFRCLSPSNYMSDSISFRVALYM